MGLKKTGKEIQSVTAVELNATASVLDVSGRVFETSANMHHRASDTEALARKKGVKRNAAFNWHTNNVTGEFHCVKCVAWS